jgi:hypothetical protein
VSKIALAALLLAGVGLTVQSQDDNLIKNPGFEESAATTPYLGWIFVNHGQDFIRGEIQAQNYHGGLKAACVTITEKPKVYACWTQTVSIEKDEQIPDEISLWYSAPDSGFNVLVFFTAIENGKAVVKGTESFPVEKSISWREATFKLPNTYSGISQIRVELRTDQIGKYLFDDVCLTRREKPFSGKPEQILFVDNRLGIPSEQRLPAIMREAFEKRGWSKLSYITWDNLSPNLLRQSRAVVFIGVPGRAEFSEKDTATIKLLQQYVEAGGGVLLMQETQQNPVNDLTMRDALARAFGTRILLETVVSDPALTRQIGKWGPDIYTFTDQVKPPVADGVRGVCYHSCVHPMVLYGVLPFLPEAPWQVVLSAGPKSYSSPTKVGLEVIDKEARLAGFDKAVPLAGIREYGAGRAAYVGLLAGNIFTRSVSNVESRETYTDYMTKGWEGCPSDLLTFYANVIQWISGSADKLELADWKKWTNPTDSAVKRSFTWKLHKGVIGARTSYSTGTSTPDDYVKKAKEAGLDFIVFLEDFAALKSGGFENLKQDCRKLSDANFAAIPGVTCENTDGNNEYFFSDSIKLPSMDLLDRTGKKIRVYMDLSNGQSSYVNIHYLYALLAFENTAGWYNFSKNPYPNYDARNVNSMAVITQENGLTVDRELNGYMINNRNGQSLWPFALTLMKSAAEIDRIKEGSYFTNVIGAEGIEQVVKSLTTNGGRSGSHLYPVVPPFGQTFITQGPIIELVMPRADTDAEGDLYNKKLQEWELSLKVMSDVGLKEVLLIDGDTTVRRFLPGGEKNFSFKTSIAKERQKYLWVHAKDINGKEAISRAINCNSWILRENQCADRNNQLLDSRQLRPDGTPFFVGYGGDTAIPDKGPWNGRIRPVGCFVFDKKLGVGGFAFDGSPENHPQCQFNPFIVYDGQVPKSIGWVNQLVADKEGGPHVMPHRVVASSEVLIGDRILDGVFPLSANPVIHVWHSVYPVQPSKYLKTTARTSFYLVKPDGVSAYLWEQDFEPLQDIPTKPDQPYVFSIGNISSRGAKEMILMNGQTVTAQGPVKAGPVKTYPFNKGDYVGFLKNPFGSLAVYSLTDGLVLQGDCMNFTVGVKPPESGVKEGTKFKVKLLLIGMHNQVENPASLAATIRTAYGLSGDSGNQVEAKQGKVVGQEYRLDIEPSADGCFLGTAKGLDKLSGNLGCALLGMNDRWTVFFQQQDAKVKTRILPVEEKTAYCVMTAADEGKLIFIGHPVVTDNPELVLNVALSKDWKSWLLEIHNPTNSEITSNVKSSPHVKSFKFAERIKLAPGTSQFRTLGPIND